MLIRVADERLGSEVKDDFGPSVGDDPLHIFLISNVGDVMPHHLLERGLREEARDRGRLEGHSDHLGSHAAEP